MDPRLQVKLDKYKICGNIISQTSLLSSHTGSETDADSSMLLKEPFALKTSDMV